jgi:fermentation-respiration switch protein FrsA (DUF1100 family)
MNQNNILYVPDFPSGSKAVFLNPLDFNLRYVDEVMMETPDGMKLQAWFVKVDDENYKNAPTILYFQENAGNLSHRLPFMKDMIEKMKMNVFILSYRGYGSSTGVPSEAGLKIDARVALDYLINREDLKDSIIYVFGRSLGGAVAIDILSKDCSRVKALILENTFTSIHDMIDVLFPFLRYLKSLSHNKWESIESVKNISIPTLFICGESDEVVPAGMVKSLYESCKSEKKSYISFKEGRHMTTYEQEDYYPSIMKFLGSVE